MRRRTAVLLAALGGALGLIWLLLQLSLEVLAVLPLAFIVAAAVPATLFPFCLAWISRGVWWRTAVGRALFVSTTALALLLDLTLLFRVVEVDERTGLIVTNVVLSLVMAGAWLKLGALIHEWWRARKPDGA